MASLTLRPGARVRLKGQDAQVPDFYVVRCHHDHCAVRQGHWSPETVINIQFTQLYIPGHLSPESIAPGGVVPDLPPLVSSVAPGARAMGARPAMTQEWPTPGANNVIDMATYRRRKAR